MCPRVTELQAYAALDRSGQRQASCHAHLQQCSLCRMRLDGLLRIEESVREMERRRPGRERGESTWHPVRIAPPVTLGSLKLQRLLHRSDHGVCFEGHDSVLKRAVSGRFLLNADARLLSDLRQTAILGDLREPSLNPLHYVDVVEEFPLIVSDLCPGVPLSSLGLGDAFAPEARCALILQIGELLGTLHVRGNRHGQLSQQNVFVDASGSVRLCDYGLPVPALPDGSDDAYSFVRLGAPELDHREATSPTDVYALGSLAIEIWTGMPVVSGALPDVRTWHAEQGPNWTELQRAGLPAPLCDVLRISMGRDPNARHATGMEFVSAWQTGCKAAGLAADETPALAEAVRSASRSAPGVATASKVRANEVQGLVGLLAQRHGWWPNSDSHRDTTWLERVYPELQRVPDPQRGALLEELLDNDRAADSAATAGAMATPIVILPLLGLFGGFGTLLGGVFFIVLAILIAWLLTGLARLGYALLSHRTLRMKLRRRLLAGGTPICLRCGYDLRGAWSALCPECGYAAPLIQFRVQVRGQDEQGAYDLNAYMNSLTPATASTAAYHALREDGFQVLDIMNVRQEPGWSADWPIGLLRVGEKEYLAQ